LFVAIDVVQERDRDMKKMMARLHKLQTEQQRAVMNEQRHFDERQQLQACIRGFFEL
jgi:hypothetical protein